MVAYLQFSSPVVSLVSPPWRGRAYTFDLCGWPALAIVSSPVSSSGCTTPCFNKRSTFYISNPRGTCSPDFPRMPK